MGFGDGDVLSGWRTVGFECIQCMSLEAISLQVSPVLSFARKLKALKDDLKHGLERRMALEAAAVETAVTDVYRDGRSLLSWSGRKFGYWKNLKRNHEDLMQKARELWELSNGLDAAEWIVKVEMNESEVIEKSPMEIISFWKGASLSKDMAEKCNQVHSLWEEENRVAGIRPAKIDKPPLHKYVEDANRNLGNGGNRKSTIIEHLNTHDNINKMFDMVIRVTVPKEWSVVGFQQKIMDWLQLNMGKNIIGIHNIKSCKVVLMNVDEAINVKPLSDDEAFNINFPKVTQVAQVVVKECGVCATDKLAKAFKIKPREGLKEPPNPEEWKQVYRISLMDNELHSLPEALDCCDLVTLLLQRNKNLVAIPEFFFTSMCHLRVLDLHGTGITSLPSSLCNLIGLRVLYLNSCIQLVGLPTDIEALKQLEVLDIRGTKLSLHQIRTLTWLKSLRMSLSNFGRGSQTQNQSGNVSSFVSLEEFVHCLEFFVSSSPAWKDLFVRTSPAWEDLSFTFQFAVGYQNLTCFQILESFEYPGYNCLKFINGEGINPVISKVLAKTHAFGLINHKGVSRLSDFGIENMNDLFICSIEGCNEIETIINGTGITKSGPVHAESLTLLRTLVLLRCPQLKKIFSNGMIQQLSKLEDLRVEECDQIEEIIMKLENNGLEANQLPRLKTLTLLHLLRLRSIWVDDSLEWRSLQRIEISMCHMLKRLPFNNANATKLRCIEGQQAWWEALQWMDDGAIK
ncbi:hypothetical protein AAG906_003867 [Vitis piasezkii]